MIPQLEIRIVATGAVQEIERILTNCILKGSCTGSEMYRSRDGQNIARGCVLLAQSAEKASESVFLEAMAAGKPIVAVRAGAVRRWYVTEFWWNLKGPGQSPMGCSPLSRPMPLQFARFSQLADVEQFDVRRVARLFLSEVTKVAPGIAAGSRTANRSKTDQSEELV